MTADMVAAKAVIADAAGAIAEFQLGMLRVRPAAYGAFVGIGQSAGIAAALPCGSAIGCILRTDTGEKRL